METEKINEQISESEKKELEFAERMKATMKVITGIIIVSYILVVWPLLYMGIDTVSIPVVGFVASTIVIPVLTFFAGIWIVWKFKFMQYK